MRLHAAFAPLGVAAGFVDFASRSAEVAFCLELALESTCLGDRSNIPLPDRFDVRKEHELQVHSQGNFLLPCVKPFGPLHCTRLALEPKR